MMDNIKYTDCSTFRCLENLRETSIDIGLVHTGREKCLPMHTCSGPREEYIIHFVLSGKGFYSTEKNTWTLGPGQMFLIYPGEPVTYGSDKLDPWSYAWIGFHGIRADSILKQCGFSHSSLVLPAPKPALFMSCIEQMMEHKALTYADDLRREACLLNLFSILIDHNESLSKTKTEKYAYGTNVYVEMAIEYIKLMYMHGINVSDIADNIGISRAHLTHAFQKELGFTVQKFLIDYRMHKAANLLAGSGMSVKEVSSHVGYEDQLTFSKAFKKKFGMSPKNYRDHKDTIVKFSEKQ